MSSTRIGSFMALGLVCALAWGGADARATVGPDKEVVAAIEGVLDLAIARGSESEKTLLPKGAIVDDTQWREGVLWIYLTVPERITWRTQPLAMEELSELLGSPFAEDEDFGGVVLRVRQGNNGEYGDLSQFMITRIAKSEQLVEKQFEPDADLDGFVEYAEHEPVRQAKFGGPVTQAVGQPSGALSGVTVFVNGGHGWTAGTSAWYLQRDGDLNEMNEDYGNLDQLNYFVHYAFNAGATVVPMRPAGWQSTEIVLDNDDPGVTYTGSWSNGSASKYYENGVTNSGVIYRAAATSTTESATARYTPTITTSGYYPVYCWTLASTNRTTQLYRIAHSGGISEVVVDHRMVGNGWIWLGEYYFESSGTNYVEISNESSVTGYVIADAIRWGSGMGDISRPGPNSVSGYPRDEECARYWAQSEMGNNAAGFTAADIWDASTTDQNDNVSVGARWAKEMNQTAYNNDRWRRVFYEFHTNAAGGTARGCVALITDLGATTYQSEFATYVANEIDADMAILDSDFEHTWYDRSSPTLTGSYGAITSGATGNEFDATIVELAFHDNATDAELLRDSRVRAALAKSSVQAIIRFLNFLPNSTVPLAFPPDVPTDVSVVNAGGGNVTISWSAPPSDGARGDAATGYVIYESSNGRGFGNPTVVGNVTSTTLSGLAAGETKYYRITATNSGGQSMPSEVMAVRRPTSGTAEVLVVCGFDRLERYQNWVQEFTFPTAYAGLSPERQIWRKGNTYDYAIQYVNALADADMGVSTCDNEAIISGAITLGDFDAVFWISGEESTSSDTFDSNEQSAITTYLNGGGNLLVSGSEIGWDLDDKGTTADRAFYNNCLKTDYASDDANTHTVSAASGSIFDGVSQFNFDDGTLFYDSQYPDGLAVSGGSTAALNYVGGNGGVAGVVYDGTFKVVSFGFPFETITTASDRSAVMLKILQFFFPSLVCSVPADCDDGLYCNGAETCVNNICQAGTAIDCDDSVACTTDFCNESTDSCDNTPNDSLCDNGLYCDGAETCHATNGCQFGTAVDCDDSVACTDDSCNESTDSCDNIANDANCDNGLWCDGAETCHATNGCQAGTDPCLGQSCDEATDQCVSNDPVVAYEWDMDTNPGWTTSGQWAWGAPTGGGGDHGGPDPTLGYTGNNVYGYNLSGDYGINLSQTHLTTTAIDCTDLTDVTLKFRRWLGVEQPSYDHAYVAVSNNGTSWTTIWENTAEVAETAWSLQEYDISTVADNQSTVYIRWTIGTTDGSWQYCGWNIDDVQIVAIAADPECTIDSECDDGVFCNGAETCVGIFCQAGTDPCPGQTCDEVNDQCVGAQMVYSWNMNTNPGWATQGQWAWGTPTGDGGDHGNPDPTSGYTGSNVYGYNLSGDYANSLSETHLTTTAINCTGMTDVTLKFYRYLGVEQPSYDHAYLKVSNNGSSWTTVWENTAEVADSSWSLQEYDISAVADGESTVYIRWTIGTTDSSWQYCGWNIDDVEIWAVN